MMLFRMSDMLTILNLPEPQKGQCSHYVTCPCCGKEYPKPTLNVNIKKEVYRCPRCNTSGGVLDLYSLYTGTPRKKVCRTLTRQFGTTTSEVRAKVTAIRIERQNEYDDAQ